MSVRNVTMTSKNQITLPSEYVKNLRLGRGRVLRAELQEGKITLSPHPSLDNVMQQFWGRHNAIRPLTDAEIKQAVRTSSTERAARTK